jgi:hypothetical protein
VPTPGILSNSASVIRRKVPIVFIGVAVWRRDLTRTAHPCISASQRIRTSMGVRSASWRIFGRAPYFFCSVARRRSIAALAATICATRPGLTLNWLAMAAGLRPLRKRRTIVEFLSPFCLGMAGPQRWLAARRLPRRVEGRRHLWHWNFDVAVRYSPQAPVHGVLVQALGLWTASLSERDVDGCELRGEEQAIAPVVVGARRGTRNLLSASLTRHHPDGPDNAGAPLPP